jgi:hypothetical protein
MVTLHGEFQLAHAQTDAMSKTADRQRTLLHEFALSENREEVLNQLIPGSVDYFYYHTLHYQTTNNLAAASSMLAAWQKSKFADRDVESVAKLRRMSLRQNLLEYPTTPQKTIDYLRREFDVPLEYAGPIQSRERRYPDRFDSSTLEAAVVITPEQLDNGELRFEGLQWLATWVLENPEGVFKNRTAIDLAKKILDEPRCRFLNNLELLVRYEFLARPINLRKFGDLIAHQNLTLEELNSLARSVDDLPSDVGLVTLRLRRMLPADPIDTKREPERWIAYLDATYDYTTTLPFAFDRFKARVLGHLLQAKADQGQWSVELFDAYLKLPHSRQEWQIVPLNTRNQAPVSQLAGEFPFGPELTSSDLVHRYLLHFLAEANSSDAFSQTVQSDVLKRTFAEAKLLAGKSPAADYFAMLSASEQARINDRIELEINAGNRVEQKATEAAFLSVDLKHVNELRIQIYQIDAAAFYKRKTGDRNTGIDLDGLVPTHSRKLEYDFPAHQRHRERIELPEIRGRGFWIVDLLGGGVRSRAEIRRGTISSVIQNTADAQIFTLLDENLAPVLGGRVAFDVFEFQTNDQGQVAIPLVREPLTRNAILSDGEVADELTFAHLSPNYELAAEMLTVEEQIVPDSMANLLVRAQLRSNGTLISAKAIDSASLEVLCKDIDNIPTSRKFNDLTLSDSSDLHVEFRVPKRTQSIRAILTIDVKNPVTGAMMTVASEQEWSLANRQVESITTDAFLAKSGNDWVIELRGQNGEPMINQVASVNVSTHFGGSAIYQQLQSNDKGQLLLTADPTIHRLDVSFGGQSRDWNLNLQPLAWPHSLVAATTDPIQLPLSQSDKSQASNATRFRLQQVELENRRGEFSQQITIANGMLTVRDLPVGIYTLFDSHSQTEVSITVVDGEQRRNVITTEDFAIQMPPRKALAISETTITDGELQIRLSGDAEAARVHVIAHRYTPASMRTIDVDFPSAPAEFSKLNQARSRYTNARSLGDEYEYILRRQEAEKFPGVMLPQPSLLLNPWSIGKTENDVEQADAGSAMTPKSSMRRSESEAELYANDSGRAASQKSIPSTAFLATQAVLISNLKIDDGRVSLNLDSLGDCGWIEIMACNPTSMTVATVTRPLVDAKLVDQRLARSLPVDRFFSFDYAVRVASQNQPVSMADFGEARIVVIDDQAKLFQYFSGVIDDEDFEEFEVLTRWHLLDDAEKATEYRRLASHELHLFLAKRDKPFFDRVVKPYLANKHQRGLVDEYLLGRDLARFETVDQMVGLNAFELALLARAVPKIRPAVARHFRDRVAAQEMTVEQRNRPIQIALESLANFALDGTEELIRQERQAGEAKGNGVLHEFLGAAVDKSGDRYGLSPEKRRAGRVVAPAAPPGDSAYGNYTIITDDSFFGAGLGRGRTQAFYENLSATEQWAESNYFRSRNTIDHTDYVSANEFWLDWIEQADSELFLSTHLLQPSDRATSALAVMALSDLPFVSTFELPASQDAQISPETPVALISKQLVELTMANDESEILIGQQIHLASEENKTTKKSVQEFVAGVVYTASIVATNTTPVASEIDLFWQVPAGAIPLGTTRATDSKNLNIEAYSTAIVTFNFYFPAAGSFQQYPPIASKSDTALGQATAIEFDVLSEPSESDERTWAQIAATGSADEIADALKSSNLYKIDLRLVLHRLSDRDAYESVLSVLEENRFYDARIWAFSLKHNDANRLSTWLAQNDTIADLAGPWLNSPILTLDAYARNQIEYLEYAPLVVPRIHRLKNEVTYTNPEFANSIEQLMQTISAQPQLTPNDHLAMSYYFLVNNQVADALRQFNAVARDEIDSQLQYDYLAAYLAMHQADYEKAESIARTYASYPVQRWQERFGTLIVQLESRNRMLVGLAAADAAADSETASFVSDAKAPETDWIGRDNRMADATSLQPTLSLAWAEDRLRLSHRNLQSAVIALRPVDLELLFSKTPFVLADLTKMAFTTPLRSIDIELNDAKTEYAIPKELEKQTLLVEVTSGGLTETTLYTGGGLQTSIAESFGQLQVVDALQHPVSTAYVKVYSRLKDGRVVFYKDGYTDLRGRFDYATVSNDQLAQSQRFAILVLHPELGASTHEVAPPK